MLTMHLSGKPIIDPRVFLEYSRRMQSPADFYQRANSVRMPRGRHPGQVWLGMALRDLNAMDTNAAHVLTWQCNGNTLTIPGLTVTRTQCLNIAMASDPKAAYLVELQDKRLVLARTVANSKHYNVPMPAPPIGDTGGANATINRHYAESLNSGVLWTWQGVLGDLWAMLSGAGTVPTLPGGAGADVPNNLRFVGVSAWDAIHQVLAAINCTSVYSPEADSFSFVSIAASQSGLTSALGSLSRKIMFDYNASRTLARGGLPATIRVFFKRREEFHGIEPDSVRTGNAEMSPAYWVDVATGIAGAAGVAPAWGDLWALFDKDGTVTNSGELSARASLIAAGKAGADWTGWARRRIHFGGIEKAILPGSEIREVVWRDWGDKDGIVTEVHGGQGDEATGPTPPQPINQQVLQIVQVAGSGYVLPNSSKLFPGVVRRMTWDSLETGEACWIRALNNHDALVGGIGSLPGGSTHHGRLSGTATDGTTELPLYTISAGNAVIVGRVLTVGSGGGIPGAAMDGANRLPGLGIVVPYRLVPASDPPEYEPLLDSGGAPVEIAVEHWGDRHIPTGGWVKLAGNDSGRWMLIAPTPRVGWCRTHDPGDTDRFGTNGYDGYGGAGSRVSITWGDITHAGDPGYGPEGHGVTWFEAVWPSPTFLPPKMLVQVEEWCGGHRILSLGGCSLRGRMATTLSAGSFSMSGGSGGECDTFSHGGGTMHVFTNVGGIAGLLRYEATGEPVELPVENCFPHAAPAGAAAVASLIGNELTWEATADCTAAACG